tara:strand:+ start:1164 stop:1895 length:732 start_codon:yes stop_codon:yes gene_type:complete
MILIFSTSKRYNLFQLTLKSLIKYNNDLIDLVDKVYVLDDRSSWEDRDAMEKDLSKIFELDKISIITFNGDQEFDWVNKLNFVKKLSKNTDYILFIEDDWESTDSMNLQLHLNFLNKKKDIDLITFNGWFHIQNTTDKEKWDYVKSYNDVYYSNPYPNGFRHVISETDGSLNWIGVKINNFSLNPGLFRSEMFLNNTFTKKKTWEVDFIKGNDYKQLLVKVAPFIHRGEKDTLLQKNNNNITI